MNQVQKTSHRPPNLCQLPVLTRYVLSELVTIFLRDGSYGVQGVVLRDAAYSFNGRKELNGGDLHSQSFLKLSLTLQANFFLPILSRPNIGHSQGE